MMNTSVTKMLLLMSRDYIPINTKSIGIMLSSIITEIASFSQISFEDLVSNLVRLS